VLRGTQGTGKTIVGRIIGSLLGPHYALVADSRFIVGRFNSHLANCLLLQLDEATWGGNHDAAGKLKDLVTGEWQFIEYKGREPVKVKNYVRLLITGNNSWLVPAGIEERRFAVLDVGESARQNHAYFQAIEDEFQPAAARRCSRSCSSSISSRVNLRRDPGDGRAARAEALLAGCGADLVARHPHARLAPGRSPRRGAGRGRRALQRLHRTARARRPASQDERDAVRHRAPEDGARATKHRKQLITPGGNCRPYVYEFPALGECRRRSASATGARSSSLSTGRRRRSEPRPTCPTCRGRARGSPGPQRVVLPVLRVLLRAKFAHGARETRVSYLSPVSMRAHSSDDSHSYNSLF
jgi:hypothetical protein